MRLYRYPGSGRWLLAIYLFFVVLSVFGLPVICNMFAAPHAAKLTDYIFEALKTVPLFHSRFTALQSYDGVSGYYYLMMVAAYPALVLLLCISWGLVMISNHISGASAEEFEIDSGLFGYGSIAIFLFIMLVLFVVVPPQKNPAYGAGSIRLLLGNNLAIFSGFSLVLVGPYIFFMVLAVFSIVRSKLKKSGPK